MPDISDLLKVGGVDLERTATEIFGNAVEEFARGNLDPALRNIFGQPENPPVNRNDGSWYATSYAYNLANSNFRPKLKFLFRVEFLFKDAIIQQYPELQTNPFTFMIKSVDRPKVDMDYEEVNRYNFRTKVLKQIKHRELTMTFMDDVGNSVYDFFRIMMMVHSPITRRSALATHDISDLGKVSYQTGNGMLFTSQPGVTNDFATRAAIPTDIGNVISVIKVTQIFTQPNSGGLDNAAKEVAFLFVNPRVVSFDLDDVNHEVSEPNLFTMQFDYDFMVMAPLQDLARLPDEKSMPASKGAPSEPLPTGRSQGNTAQGGSNPTAARILAGVAGRAAQKITSETIGRQIRQIPGLSNTGVVLGGLVGSTVGGAVSSIIGSPTTTARGLISDSTSTGIPRAGFNINTGNSPLFTPGILPSDD